MESFSFTGRPFFFYRTMRGYRSVRNPSVRSSSEDTRGSGSLLLEKGDIPQLPKTSVWRRHAILISIHSFIFMLYIAVLFLVASIARSQALHDRQLIACELAVTFVCYDKHFWIDIWTAPAQSVIRWEIKKFDENSQTHGPFSGYPRDEIDENWRKILNGK